MHAGIRRKDEREPAGRSRSAPGATGTVAAILQRLTMFGAESLYPPYF